MQMESFLKMHLSMTSFLLYFSYSQSEFVRSTLHLYLLSWDDYRYTVSSLLIAIRVGLYSATARKTVYSLQ